MNDLQEFVNTQGAEVLAMLDGMIIERRRHLDQQIAFREAIARAMNGKPKAAPATHVVKLPSIGRKTLDQHRSNVLKYLEHGGVTKRSVLLEQCKISSSVIDKVIDHPWFRKNELGIALTEAGKHEIG